MIQRNFKLALTAGRTIPLVIPASQYDSGEQWIFTLIDETGAKYAPESGAIIGIKSDKMAILNAGTVDAAGRVVINETEQMTAAVGKNVYEILINDQTHGSANFIVMVEPRPGDNADFSDSDLSLLQQAIDGTSETAIKNGVQEWMDDNLAPSEWVIDSSLSTSGAAADAKKVGDELSALKSAIAQGSGLTSAIKSALLQIAQKVAYIDEDGQTYYDDLYDALYPPIVVTNITLNARSLSFRTLNSTQQLTATTTPVGGEVIWTSSNPSVATVSATGLVTAVAYGNATITATSGNVSATCSVVIAQATVTQISAVFNQVGVTVYETDSLDSLKEHLTVRATYSDNSTVTLDDSDYTLSGTLEVGTSPITVSYGGKTTTFNVTVSAVPEYGTFTPTNIVEGSYIDASGDAQTAQYASYSSDYYDSAVKVYSVNFANLYSGNPNWRFCEYDASKNFLRQIHITNVNGDAKGQPQVLSMLDETKYFRLSWYGENQLRVPEVTINNAPYVNLPMEIGDIDATTGEDVEQPLRMRSVDYLPVSGTTLTIKNYKPFLASTPDVTSYGFLGRCYDSSKNIIGSIGWTTKDSTITMPDNTAYIRPILQFGTKNIPDDFDAYACFALILNSVNYRIVKASL